MKTEPCVESFAEFVSWLERNHNRNIAVVGEQTPCVGIGCGYGPSPIDVWLDEKYNTMGATTRLEGSWDRVNGRVPHYLQWRFVGEWERLPDEFYRFDIEVNFFTSGGRDYDAGDQRITAQECLELVRTKADYIYKGIRLVE